MRFNELVKLLEKSGWKLQRTGKSSLRVFVKNGERIIVHYHGNAEVPSGTANDTLKKAGIK